MKIISKITIAIILTLSSIVSLSAQTKSVITHLSIENKKNGAFVKLFTTSAVDAKHITGWTNENGWFYITVLGAIADSGRVVNSELSYPISEIEVNNVEESAQIALKVNNTIENFEFYQSTSPPEILVSLRFPIGDIASALEEERDRMADTKGVTAEDINPPQDEPDVVIPDRYKRIRSALYLTGASLTVAGVAVEAQHSEGFSWEIPTGIAIMAGTFIYDKYFHKSDKE